MNVLTVENLRISYRSQREWREVVHDVSFAVKRGEMLAFVGESGSGKTTTAQAIIGLLADNARRDSGRISINGEEISGWSAKRLDGLRGARISLVPQDPGNSLNPVKTIGAQVGEILRLHQQSSAAERKAQVLALLAKLGHSTAFIGKVGADGFGTQLENALKETGISTQGLCRDEKVHTTLAVVHTLADGDRDFSFYRNPGADMQLCQEEVPFELIQQAKIFHFGTLSMTDEPVLSATYAAMAEAERCGVLRSFDPNLRPPLWRSLKRTRCAMG